MLQCITKYTHITKELKLLIIHKDLLNFDIKMMHYFQKEIKLMKKKYIE